MNFDTDASPTIIINLVNFLIWCGLYFSLGLHKDRLRYSSLRSYTPILKLSFLIGTFLVFEGIFLFESLNIFASVFSTLLILNFLVGLRVFARELIRKNLEKVKKNILVYGVSDIAIDLVNAMTFSKKYKIVAFISDVPQKIHNLAGLPVIQLAEVEHYKKNRNCQLVVLATPGERTSEHSQTLHKFDELGLSVSYAPTMDRAFDYEVQLKAVRAEDVLGRPTSSIEFDQSLHHQISGRTILVTGAGGSIGSELCRQLLRYQPEKLVFLEINEFALYSLEQELEDLKVQNNLSVEMLYVLGSVLDSTILEEIFENNKVNTVYHAAAYKHVPIIEENIAVGINNNVFGTKLVAEFSRDKGVDKFVLISSDKAVRPTNVMGASKRLAELLIQNFAKSSKTIFTMVRFGNVLGSSGSVIPKFKSQIKAGGPVTVTHPDINRYFMSTPEAAYLVLNAGTLAEGGDVFLLDMGEPIKILDLAKSMIRQHGLQPIISDDLCGRLKNDNELLIEFTGLRPGEKLYEELLVDGISEKTLNPKIFKSKDYDINQDELNMSLTKLAQFIADNNSQEILKLLKRLPIEYSTNSKFSTSVSPESETRAKHKITAEETNIQSHEIFPESNEKRFSFLQRFISSKLGLAILHRYFLFSRGMTLGVRVLVRNQNREILFVKHSYIDGWHLPGGGVDRGEDVYAAAIREVYEETGITDLRNLRFLDLELNQTVSMRDHVAVLAAETSQDIQVKNRIEITDVKFMHFDYLKIVSKTESNYYLKKYMQFQN